MTLIVRWLIHDIFRPLMEYEDWIHENRTGVLASCWAKHQGGPAEPWAVAREVRPGLQAGQNLYQRR